MGKSRNLKIIFLGTPKETLPVLEMLAKNFQVVAVVTQPPKPTGRKKLLTYSPVDSWAFKRKIPIIFDLDKIPQADLGVCASFGKVIPKGVIDQFPFGIVNIHFSLLPRFRGPSPVAAAIDQGEQEIGVSLFLMDEKIDHGPILTQFKEEILPEDTTGSLRERLFVRTAVVLKDLIPPFVGGKVRLKPQDESQATGTKILTKEDGFIDLTKTKAKEAERHIRAMDPWPGAWTYVKTGKEKKRLKILKAHLEKEKLILDEVQLEGKTPVSWQEFKTAYPSSTF